jgi:hypothetical protein
MASDILDIHVQSQENGWNEKQKPPMPPPRSIQHYTEFVGQSDDAMERMPDPIGPSTANASFVAYSGENGTGTGQQSPYQNGAQSSVNRTESGLSYPYQNGKKTHTLPGSESASRLPSVGPILNAELLYASSKGHDLRSEPQVAQKKASPRAEENGQGAEDMETVDIKATLETVERWPVVKNGYLQLITFLIFFGLYCAVVMLQIDPGTVSFQRSFVPEPCKKTQGCCLAPDLDCVSYRSLRTNR